MTKTAVRYARVSSKAQADKGHKTGGRVTGTLDYEQLNQILMLSRSKAEVYFCPSPSGIEIRPPRRGLGRNRYGWGQAGVSPARAAQTKELPLLSFAHGSS
jgi:hypothetical protein